MRFIVFNESCVSSGRGRSRSGCAVAEIQSPYHQMNVTACAMKLEKNGTNKYFGAVVGRHAMKLEKNGTNKYCGAVV